MRRRLKMFVGWLIWDLCEGAGISLGSLGPTVFAWMMGSDGRRIK